MRYGMPMAQTVEIANAARVQDFSRGRMVEGVPVRVVLHVFRVELIEAGHLVLLLRLNAKFQRVLFVHTLSNSKIKLLWL